MLENETEFLKNKRVYLAPYNDLTLALKQRLMQQGIVIKGFFDKYKSGKDIFLYNSSVQVDCVLIDSPNYWPVISANFDTATTYLCNKLGRQFISIDEYQEAILKEQYFDVLLLAFNKSNVTDLAMIARELRSFGLSSALVDIEDRNSLNFAQGMTENSDIATVSRDALPNIKRHALVASIDWEPSFGRPFIEKERAQGELTIGIIDGIEDFDDTDYDYDRNAYQTVEYVLTMGQDDQKSLTNKLAKTAVVGLPKLFPLYKEFPTFPKKDLVVINVNFTYGSFEDARENWLKNVVKACNSLNLDYVVTHHHADKGDLVSYPVSSENAYDTLRRGSILISRFSTLILESLVLGKPVVYFNPHDEKVSLYKTPLGAFSVANTVEQLISKIALELQSKHTTRKRSFQFLENKCNISSHVEPAKLAAYRIKNLIEETHISFASQRQYKINPVYVARNQYHHYDDSSCEDEWQLEVYLHALGLMKTNGFSRVADFGCGSGYKLVKYLGDYDCVGYELPVNVDLLRLKYPNCDWRVSDFASVDDINAEVLICSDVIEHLIDPDELITYFKNQTFKYLIISTPERDLCYAQNSVYLMGPPKNPAHQREWNFEEFKQYISLSFDILDHRVTNLQQATQMVICQKYA